MIDNITIRLTQSQFSGGVSQLINCGRYVKRGRAYSQFNIPSKGHSDSSLSLRIYEQTGLVTIRGSLRKWWYGSNSFRDLTSTHFNEALIQLSKSLNMPYAQLREASFSQCEIGLNVRVRIPPQDIEKRILKYGRLCLEKRESIAETTLYFKGVDKTLVLYDKGKERFDMGGDSIKKLSQALARNGIYYLRIEFRLKDKKAFMDHGLGKINNLGSLGDNYRDLYLFWAQELSHLKMVGDVEIPDAPLSIDEILILSGYQTPCCDASELMSKYAEYCQSKGRTPKSKNVQRSRAISNFITILEEYGIKSEYDLPEFKMDIIRQLIKIRKTGDFFDLAAAIRLIIRGNN